MELADKTAEGNGFAIIQIFEPIPLINILNGKGFLYLTEKITDFEYKIYFYRKETSTVDTEKTLIHNKLPLVIQSATPVVYPVLLKMIQSERLNDLIEVKELKVWEETEKHMGWITNGKADFTFSAIVASSKLYATGQDIKLLSIDVWDNFNLLTRGYKADSFHDLKGHTIHMPLFKSAPPYAVTSYLMKMEGLEPTEFDFQYGEPFGRPEELKAQFITGEIDTVLLREPEASFVIANLKDTLVFSLNYGDIWKKLHPEFDRLPNAGLIVKGELFQNHKHIVDIFIEELEKATIWVKENPYDAAVLAHEEMGVTIEEAKLFCERVVFHHRKASKTKKEIMKYMQILKDQGIVKLKKDIDDSFFGL